MRETVGESVSQCPNEVEEEREMRKEERRRRVEEKSAPSIGWDRLKTREREGVRGKKVFLVFRRNKGEGAERRGRRLKSRALWPKDLGKTAENFFGRPFQNFKITYFLPLQFIKYEHHIYPSKLGTCLFTHLIYSIFN